MSDDTQAARQALAQTLRDAWLKHHGVFHPRKWDTLEEEAKLEWLVMADTALASSRTIPAAPVVTIDRDIAQQLLTKLGYIAAAFKGDKQTRDKLIPAMRAALEAASRREGT